MRTTVDRFMLRGFFSKVGVMLFLMLGVYLLSEALNESRDLGEGDYGLPQLLAYLGLRIPAMAFELAPFAVLLGTLVLLGELSRHAELTALRAGGLSLARLARPLLVGGLIVAGISFLVNDRMAGHLSYLAQRYAQEWTKGPQQGRWLPGGGIWFRDGEWVVSAARVARDGRELRGVRLYRLDKEGLLDQVVRGRKLVFREGGWALRGGRQLDVAELREAPAGEQGLSLRLRPDLLAELGKSPERMSFERLGKYIRKLRRQGQPVGGLAFDLWQKVTIPLSCLVMVLVAVPFVSLSPRGTGRVGRLIGGIAVGLAFHAGNVLAGHVTAAGVLSAPVAAWLPPVVFGILGGLLLLRSR